MNRHLSHVERQQNRQNHRGHSLVGHVRVNRRDDEVAHQRHHDGQHRTHQNADGGTLARTDLTVDERGRHRQEQRHQHSHQRTPRVGEHVRHKAEHRHDCGGGRTIRKAGDQADDAGRVVLQPSDRRNREFNEAGDHRQRHEQCIHGDTARGPAAGIGHASGV